MPMAKIGAMVCLNWLHGMLSRLQAHVRIGEPMSGCAKESPVNKSKFHQQTAVHEAIILILVGQHNKGTWLLSR